MIFYKLNNLGGSVLPTKHLPLCQNCYCIEVRKQGDKYCKPCLTNKMINIPKNAP